MSAYQVQSYRHQPPTTSCPPKTSVSCASGRFDGERGDGREHDRDRDVGERGAANQPTGTGVVTALRDGRAASGLGEHGPQPTGASLD